LDELASSIDDKGLLHPIVVRTKNERFEVVAGNRRLEACKRLGWPKIACHVTELDAKESFEVGLVENLQRRTLNPIEEPLAYKHYVDEFGWGGVSDLAKRILKSQEYVSRRIRLLGLPPKVIDEVMRRRINPSIAQELLHLDYGDITEVVEMVKDRDLSSKEVRRIAKNYQRSNENEVDSSFLSFPNNTDQLKTERTQRILERAISRSVVALRLSLVSLDETIRYVGDVDPTITDAVVLTRRVLHRQIDWLLKIKRKMRFAFNHV